MNTHRLKTVNPYFQDVWDGRKPFEVRPYDRNFKVGDRVELFEYDPQSPDAITGTREIHGTIDYLFTGSEVLALQIAVNMQCFPACVFSLRDVQRIEATQNSHQEYSAAPA